MRAWSLATVAAAATLTCGEALAQSYPMDKAGKWEVTFQAAQPVTGTLFIDLLERYAADSVETGKLVTANDFSTYFDFDFVNPTTFGTVFFYVPRNFALYYDFPGVGPVVEGHYFTGRAEFSGSGPVTIDYAYLGVVPEPATWALLILGFAAAGSAIRRRPVARAA